MAGMLSMAYRKSPRQLLRALSNILEQNTAERALPLLPRNLRKASSQANSSVLLRRINAIYSEEIRYIHLTAVNFETKIVMTPQFADSITEGDIKIVMKVGDTVKDDDVVLEIETDKTAIPVSSTVSGVIAEMYVKNGDTVKQGMKLYSVTVGAVGASAPAAAKQAVEPKPAVAVAAAAVAPAPPRPPTPTKPAAVGAPPAPRPPAAPSSAIPVAAIRHAQSIDIATVRVPPMDPTKEISGTRTEHRVKMNRMRLKIAERLKLAQNTNAMLTTFNEIDMSQIMEFRKINLDAFVKKFGIKFGFMSVFVKASAYAMQDQPVLNAAIEGQDIVYRDYIDISVAVATPKGLVVPVVRNVERMNYADIELAISALGEKAKKGALAVEDMDGGTFTISNGGVFGSLMGTPIINPPQSAILGMHGIFERPIALKGQVVIRPMMYIALTYDHRLIDGREAVFFLRKIKAAVEDPRIILCGL